MTGTGTGAIATVQIFGDPARVILAKVFKPTGTKPVQFKTGEIILGTITDGGKTIDQVTIGCEAPGTFSIHCHGNPLIVEMIMQQLQHYGVTLVTADQLRTKILIAQESQNTIAVEAKLSQLNAKTLQGTKIIANQIDASLSKRARDWIENIEETPLDEIKTEAIRILHVSQAAKLMIYGCTTVLTGPPNSGKSTLLNCLAGRQKAIVTDVKGTTRDWIEATCQIGSLSLTLIDTAGLEDKFGGPRDTIGQAAQKKTAEILKEADLILLVLDNSQPTQEFHNRFGETLTAPKVITVLNKSDLPSRFDSSRLPKILSNTLKISAKEETGIEDLKQKIRQTSGAVDFDLQQSVCFTPRQENLLEQLAKAQSKQQGTSIISELLNGHLLV
jgi:tRNA modification GTPase